MLLPSVVLTRTTTLPAWVNVIVLSFNVAILVSLSWYTNSLFVALLGNAVAEIVTELLAVRILLVEICISCTFFITLIVTFFVIPLDNSIKILLVPPLRAVITLSTMFTTSSPCEWLISLIDKWVLVVSKGIHFVTFTLTLSPTSKVRVEAIFNSADNASPPVYLILMSVWASPWTLWTSILTIPAWMK